MRVTLLPLLTLLGSPALGRLQNSQTLHKRNQPEPLANSSLIAQSGLEKRDNTKYVFMHHIVGNTYSYTIDNWRTDIAQIAAKGVDAIALNIGSDVWQPAQVTSAYTAAAEVGMKMFISFDYSAFDCSSATPTINYFNQYKTYSSQFMYNGKPMLSSYEGSCLSASEWQRMKTETGAYLMPFMSGLEGQFAGTWSFLDSWFCWGCAWPQSNVDKTTADDQYYISQLGSRYATTVSMWMFTHFSSKNFYQRGDNWLITTRWEQLIAMRNQLTFVEMVTWNDWGESDYFGPYSGEQPTGTYWAQQFPHSAFFDLSQYYITAFKTGSYPAITQDAIYYWARPHAASAIATADPIGAKPSGWDWTLEYMWAVVFATSDATVTLGVGSYSQTFQVTTGVSKLQLPLQSSGTMTVQMTRNGKTVIYQNPQDFTFSAASTVEKYNYNVYASSALGSAASSSTTTSSSTSAASTATAVSWSHHGCMQDTADRATRVLYNIRHTQTKMTRTKCQSLCANYKYSGVENGTQCFCANKITGGTILDQSNCNIPCGGNSKSMCGGNLVVDVYKKKST